MTFDEIVLTICKHHRVHTLSGTFAEVLAYLEGYAKGARIGYSGSVFSQFAEWMAMRLICPRTQLWKVFRERHPDEETTIAEFARLYQEYQSTVKKSFTEGS